MVSVICVLKSGGDYNADYVKNLFASVLRHSHEEIQLICLTDEHEIEHSVHLQQNWKGWWSKIELFQFSGPCVFFDLDTVIMNDLTPIFDLVRDNKEKKIWMLKPFGRFEILASGIMAWTGNWHELFNEFNYEEHTKTFRGDQDYLSWKLKDNLNVDFIQNYVKGIYSYKFHCQGKKFIYTDTRIVCFHGKPRPHQTIHVDWVKNNWRS